MKISAWEPKHICCIVFPIDCFCMSDRELARIFEPSLPFEGNLGDSQLWRLIMCNLTLQLAD